MLAKKRTEAYRGRGVSLKAYVLLLHFFLVTIISEKKERKSQIIVEENKAVYSQLSVSEEYILHIDWSNRKTPGKVIRDLLRTGVHATCHMLVKVLLFIPIDILL